MIPYVGQMVLFRMSGRDLPAVVSQVWGPNCVNLVAFPEFALPATYTSILRAEEGVVEYRFREAESA